MPLKKLCVTSLILLSGCCPLSPDEEYIHAEASLEEDTWLSPTGTWRKCLPATVWLCQVWKNGRACLFSWHHLSQMRPDGSQEAVTKIAAGLVLLSLYGNRWGLEDSVKGSSSTLLSGYCWSLNNLLLNILSYQCQTCTTSCAYTYWHMLPQQRPQSIVFSWTSELLLLWLSPCAMMNSF